MRAWGILAEKLAEPSATFGMEIEDRESVEVPTSASKIPHPKRLSLTAIAGSCTAGACWLEPTSIKWIMERDMSQGV